MHNNPRRSLIYAHGICQQNNLYKHLQLVTKRLDQ